MIELTASHRTMTNFLYREHKPQTRWGWGQMMKPSGWTPEPLCLCSSTTLHSDSLCSEAPPEWPSWTASVSFSTVINTQKTEKRYNSPDLPVTFFISLPNCHLPQKSLKTSGEMQCWVSLISSHWDHYRFQQWPWTWNFLPSAPNK